mmetsp:Transcript_19854/g.35954  ORF Transcript_19854/g.35954 Transcript_19854/m.35954 type:complete len:199 (-) Transcript_19854:70-666(-)
MLTGVRCVSSGVPRRTLSYAVPATLELEPSLMAPRERPTPVLFARGPWHGAWAWESTMAALSQIGFECSAVRSSAADAGADETGARAHSLLGSWREEVAGLAQLASRGVPPVIVASGCAAHVACKYLESHAASGLVLVAPFPPSPGGCAERLMSAGLTGMGSVADGRVRSEPSPEQVTTAAQKACSDLSRRSLLQPWP